MDQISNRIYSFINPLLVLLAVFNISLTLYCCTQFYAYLPTSDTWVYVDFLVEAAQGRLDVTTLLDKHNGVHVLALPKLVYFADIWFTRGSGALTVIVSFLAQLASAGMFVAVSLHAKHLDKNEKIFWSLGSTVFLLSACQVESLLNPANLQWSLLVFSATFTAWSVNRYLQTKLMVWIAGIAVGVVLVGLTSVSPLLMLLPLGMYFFSRAIFKRQIVFILALVILGGIAVGIFASRNSFLLIAAWFESALKFTVNFMAPPVERLHSTAATALTGVLLLTGLWKVSRTDPDKESSESIFYKLLLWFSILLIVGTALARSYSPAAFTFRFVNIGLLFSLVLSGYLYIQMLKEKSKWMPVMTGVIFAYLVLLSYINYQEASTFGYGRNHVRLNQVAYALDIRDPDVVSALPGTIWEKPDYEFVQANKHKLKENRVGIYSDQAYQQMGREITSVTGERQAARCTLEISKMRRLLPDQAAYKLTGRARSNDGDSLSRVYFTDSKGILRGFAIPIVPSRSLWQSLQQGKQWSGFVNLDGASEGKILRAYAYHDGLLCEPQTVELPAYQPFIKKQKNRD